MLVTKELDSMCSKHSRSVDFPAPKFDYHVWAKLIRVPKLKQNSFAGGFKQRAKWAVFCWLKCQKRLIIKDPFCHISRVWTISFFVLLSDVLPDPTLLNVAEKITKHRLDISDLLWIYTPFSVSGKTHCCRFMQTCITVATQHCYIFPLKLNKENLFKCHSRLVHPGLMWWWPVRLFVSSNFQLSCSLSVAISLSHAIPSL